MKSAPAVGPLPQAAAVSIAEVSAEASPLAITVLAVWLTFSCWVELFVVQPLGASICTRLGSTPGELAWLTIWPAVGGIAAGAWARRRLDAIALSLALVTSHVLFLASLMVGAAAIWRGSFAGLCGSRLVSGAMAVVIMSGVESLVCRKVAAEHRGRVAAHLSAANPLAGALGLSGALWAARAHLAAPWICLAVLNLPALWVLLQMRDASPPCANERLQQSSATLLTVAVVALAWVPAFVFMPWFYVYLLKCAPAARDWLWLVSLLGGLAGATVQFATGRWVDRWHAKGVLASCACGTGVLLGLYNFLPAASSGGVACAVAAVVLALIPARLVPLGALLLTTSAGNNSLIALGRNLSMAVFASVGGWLMQKSGTSLNLVPATLVSGVALATCVGLASRLNRRPQERSRG